MPFAPDEANGEACITCGDVAVPLRVVSLEHKEELAVCATESGEETTVEIALVEPVEVGDTLLVHAGTALAHVGATG